MDTEEAPTPLPLSPPRSKTPPTITGKRQHSERSASRPVSVAALNKALQQVEDTSAARSITPTGSSPSRKRQKVQNGGGGGSDRFIPNRSGQDLHASYNLLHEDGSPATPSKGHKKVHSSELNFQRRDANRTYSSLLRSEMFDNEVPQAIPQSHEGPGGPGPRSKTPPANGSIQAGPSLTPSTPHKNLFSYGANPTQSLTPRSTSRSERGPNINARSEIYSLSPVKHSSQTMLLSPRKTPRAVSKVPYKVLDAPDLQDDFYLNLVDWGPNDILAVGLDDSVYLWSRETGQVKLLCKLEGDKVTSVGWIQRGFNLAIGSNKGYLYIYDTNTERKVRTMTGHTNRISSLAWNAHVLSSGSRDRTILHRDVRTQQHYFRKLVGHKQEVCGLKWNSDSQQLASGGNDNKIFVWDQFEERWQHRWGEEEGGHKAAVKAIAWSPHQRGLLASGGGTADRCIKFWNTLSEDEPVGVNGLPVNLLPKQTNNGLGLSSTALAVGDEPSPHLIRSFDTGSQVCNLLFSTQTSEIVSTHGYSQHAINIWKYPSMQQVVSLTGHTFRVLYLSMDPKGETIVTGAGDETLRFWDCFSKREKGGRGGIVGEWGVIR
ncbi:substrate-specific activator of APC-dependent proteolysis [Extremus antarcticus]|uniref:Substrate-specific activator of APC-dependent proteolysis n=1 Tax=Extremus antarcticus TaxID=702011 RepID=A0AAJ0GAI5_9PEZI|nr:substrate-specific activator of APC-dependent proteolysis [Extremus antarcticus]